MAKKPAVKIGGQCFFITPIGDPGSSDRQRADWLYHHVIEPAAETSGLKADRADLMVGSAMIGTNIFRALSEADVCVADMTGLNPNVLYEMGVRHSLRKPIIHVAQNGTRLPFDTSPHLTHFYDLAEYQSMAALVVTLTSEFEHVLKANYEVSNPFTQALGNIELSRSADPKDQVIAQLSRRLERLEMQAASRSSPISPMTMPTDRSSALTFLAHWIDRAGLSRPQAVYNPRTFARVVELTDSADFDLFSRLETAIDESPWIENKTELRSIIDDHRLF